MTNWFRAASQVPVAFPVLWIRRASPPAPGPAHAGCTASAHRQAHLQHPHSRDSTLGSHPPFGLVVGAVPAGLQLLLSPPWALHCCGAQVSPSTGARGGAGLLSTAGEGAGLHWLLGRSLDSGAAHSGRLLHRHHNPCAETRFLGCRV